MKFISHAANTYSQYGEDGIVEAILAVMPSRNRWCVEFGAWDGIYLSNTRRLIEKEQYKAVLIEANPASYKTLVENNKAFNGIVCLDAFVGFSDTDSLDVLLAKTECPIDFDFLSIDIDGNDIHVWRAMQKYRPKLVCAEFNPTMPDGVIFEQPAEPMLKWGSSLDAFKALARDKGYTVVCVNETNIFCVSDECWSQIENRSEYASEDRLTPSNNVFLFCGYDGTLLTSKPAQVHWHGVQLGIEDIQPLPRFLRGYPREYSALQRLGFRIYRKLRALRR